MAEPLHDLRAKITPEAHCALAAHGRAHDVEKGDLVRQILHEWAERQIHSATVLASCLRAKGMTAAAERIVGKVGETLVWDDDAP